MTYKLAQIEEAYRKLKSYIYYDNTDILLRKRLVEFETDSLKNNFFSSGKTDKVYGPNLLKNKRITFEQKLTRITEALNEHASDPRFFDYFLNKISVQIYPKKISEPKSEPNFIRNNRVQPNYDIERVTAFIDAPIEIHILTVLWIIEFGRNFDSALGSCCLGNRLILSKDKEKVVQGSSLFKPYYSQYQRWRDESVTAAQNVLKSGTDVLFLNLDIQDYFHSVRMSHEVIGPGKAKFKHIRQPSASDNLKSIFLSIHILYTERIAKDFHLPYNFYKDLKKDPNNNITEFILPIGLLSSYVLANYHLKEFDNRVLHKIKPVYYGRYVDDILLVIANPIKYYDETETNEQFRFSFKNYKENIKRQNVKDESITFDEEDLNELEGFILKNIYPVIKIIDRPSFINGSNVDGKPNKKIFKLNGYQSLYCQGTKSLVYYFEHNESDMVIDKLKKDLNERTSEFRDFPEEGENDDTFEESAYHLLYDGTEGKIKTLKDYKENRYGLTVFLANKIFSALRHEKIMSEKETEQVLKFFRGLNSLDFYRLWEKIFTFFLVNDRPKAYVSFYLHCFEEILKIQSITNKKISPSAIKETLIDYLDTAHEITLSLNPTFINKTPDIYRQFEFRLTKLEANLPPFFKLSFASTKPDSIWMRRFRATNMLRQHYIIHPLLTFTEGSKKTRSNLIAVDVPIDKYVFDDELLNNSPRLVKFWECCIAIAIRDIGFSDDTDDSNKGNSKLINQLSLHEKTKSSAEDEDNDTCDYKFYLDDAFVLYKQINQHHIPDYLFQEKNLKKQFFERDVDEAFYDETNPIKIQEIRINSKGALSDFKIAFCNTAVDENNIISSIRNRPNITLKRYSQLAAILKKARAERSEILLFPECFTPMSLLSSIVRYSEKNDCMAVSGLEHIVSKSNALNFVVTILPVKIDKINDAVVVFRLKNHYSHSETSIIDGNHCKLPAYQGYRYDIFNWKNIYFSPFYCFELANSFHRSLMKGKIDLLIAIEWNRDTPYFSNIVETVSRDIHVFVAQVNTSQYGDTRLTAPVESARKDIIRLKGGTNDAILVAPINIFNLREFQRKKFSITHHLGEFKPLPPDFSVADVIKRIQNKSIL